MTQPPLPARRDEQIEAMAKAAYDAWEPPFGKLQWHEADLAQGFRAGYLAALAAASPSPGEGWVLVPREPHFRQCAAGRAALGRKPSERVYDLMGEIYAAMIAAAPPSPAEEEAK